MLEKNDQFPNSENKTSFLFALLQLHKLKVRNIGEVYKGKVISTNRMNRQGEVLEWFIRDLFSDSYSIKDWETKEENWKNYFFYLGNNNRPPDFITRDGIAVEVKKMENASTIHFNSSYPKKYFPYPPDKNDKNKEKKISLDTLYIIGRLSKTKDLEMLWFVCGDCLFAENEFYK